MLRRERFLTVAIGALAITALAMALALLVVS
jgi:hypothetical protein